MWRLHATFLHEVSKTLALLVVILVGILFGHLLAIIHRCAGTQSSITMSVRGCNPPPARLASSVLVITLAWHACNLDSSY